MRSKQAFRFVMTTLTLCILMASTALTFAQETAEVTSAPTNQVQGVGTLFLLIGLGAVGLISLVSLARERAAGREDDAA